MNNQNQMKDATYYLGLNYPITHKVLCKEEGGGVAAYINDLGENTFSAVGETLEEALDNLDEIRVRLITELVGKGLKLPEPKEDDTVSYSGSLMLRIPKSLHGQLVRSARDEGVSLNKLATQYLAEGGKQSEMVADLNRRIDVLMEQMNNFDRYSNSGILGRSVGKNVDNHAFLSMVGGQDDSYETAA